MNLVAVNICTWQVWLFGLSNALAFALGMIAGVNSRIKKEKARSSDE